MGLLNSILLTLFCIVPRSHQILHLQNWSIQHCTELVKTKLYLLLDQLLIKHVDHLLIKCHLKTHLQSIQPDPKPSQYKEVRIEEQKLQLFHVYPSLIALHPIDCGRGDRVGQKEGWKGAALAISPPQTPATGGEDLM